MQHNTPLLRAISLATLALCATGYAQTRPDAGQIQRQAQPESAQKPLPSGAALPLTSPTPSSAPAGDANAIPNIEVREVQISGATLFSDAALRAVLGDVSGQRSLAQLQEAAARITRYYNQGGYLLARAYLPAQRMEGGVLHIAVLEGKLAALKVDNASRLSDAQLKTWFSAQLGTSDVQSAVLDRKLLLLGDTPGNGQVSARLEPGESVGESTMNLKVQTAPVWNGRVLANNYGGLYSGRAQVGALLNADSALGLGERLSLIGVVSEGQLHAGQASIDLPVGANGMRVNAEIARTAYVLGDSFAALDASGTSDIVGLALSYALLRSSQQNLSLRLSAQHQELRDVVGSTSTQTDKKSDTLTLRIQGDRRDSTGVTLMGLGVSSGTLHIDTPSSAALDAAAARTAGSFDKLVWSLERQQSLGGSWELLASAHGQQAGKNLDSSEKFSLGGASGVRAYATGEAIGDEGWLATLEARYYLANMALNAFYDVGHVEVNKNAYLTTPNGLNRDGIGFGLKGNRGGLIWSATVAWRGDTVGTAEPDKSPRLWMQVGWQF